MLNVTQSNNIMKYLVVVFILCASYSVFSLRQIRGTQREERSVAAVVSFWLEVISKMTMSALTRWKSSLNSLEWIQLWINTNSHDKYFSPQTCELWSKQQPRQPPRTWVHLFVWIHFVIICPVSIVKEFLHVWFTRLRANVYFGFMP